MDPKFSANLGQVDSKAVVDNSILPVAIGGEVDSVVLPIIIKKNVTTGAASIDIFDGNAPFKFEIVDVIVQPRGASSNGTIKLTNGTNDITDAITCAVDKTIGRAGTIDNAYSTIAADGSLEIVCAGDAVASTIALVTIIGYKIIA